VSSPYNLSIFINNNDGFSLWECTCSSMLCTMAIYAHGTVSVVYCGNHHFDFCILLDRDTLIEQSSTVIITCHMILNVR